MDLICTRNSAVSEPSVFGQQEKHSKAVGVSAQIHHFYDKETLKHAVNGEFKEHHVFRL